MPEILVEITFFAQGPDLRGSHRLFVLHYLVEEGYRTLFDTLVLQKVTVVLSEG